MGALEAWRFVLHDYGAWKEMWIRHTGGIAALGEYGEGSDKHFRFGGRSG